MEISTYLAIYFLIGCVSTFFIISKFAEDTKNFLLTGGCSMYDTPVDYIVIIIFNLLFPPICIIFVCVVIFFRKVVWDNED